MGFFLIYRYVVIMLVVLKIYCMINFFVCFLNWLFLILKVYCWSFVVGVVVYGKVMVRCWFSFFWRNVVFVSLFWEEEFFNGIFILFFWDYYFKENCVDIESFFCGLFWCVFFFDVYEFDIFWEILDIVVVIVWFWFWWKFYVRGICRIILFSCRMWFFSLF